MSTTARLSEKTRLACRYLLEVRAWPAEQKVVVGVIASAVGEKNEDIRPQSVALVDELVRCGILRRRSASGWLELGVSQSVLVELAEIPQPPTQPLICARSPESARGRVEQGIGIPDGLSAFDLDVLQQFAARTDLNGFLSAPFMELGAHYEAARGPDQLEVSVSQLARSMRLLLERGYLYQVSPATWQISSSGRSLAERNR